MQLSCHDSKLGHCAALQPVVYGTEFIHEGMAFLNLEWESGQLQHFDLEGLTKPAVDESASEAAMKGELFLLLHSLFLSSLLLSMGDRLIVSGSVMWL